MTSSVIVQVLLGAIVPLERLTRPLPTGAATVPPQLLTTFAGLATTTPDGSPSVTATPVKVSAAPVFGLVMVKLNEEIVLAGILDGVKAFVMLGGWSAA